jgi:serine/threonine-protein kinase
MISGMASPKSPAPGPFCPRCGTGLPAGAKFCARCGTRLVADKRSFVEQLRDALGEDYEVLSELGSGGFAVVYLVRDRMASRHLAIKVMRPELMVSHELVERFKREIRLASKLDHPNILPVFFAAERGDMVYYAMPRVKGVTLKEHLRKHDGPLEVLAALRLMRDIAAALAHAHERGVIHRDIKPSNVMLDGGKALVLDFGLARALAPKGGTLTGTGEVIGSPQYLSPEQASGQSDLDHRTDIYNWGILAYEMLTGTPPFTGDSIHEVLHQHLIAKPENLGTRRPGLPEPLRDLVHRALEKERDKRHASFTEVLTTLKAMLPADGLRGAHPGRRTHSDRP